MTQPFLYPSVTSLPGQTISNDSDPALKNREAIPGEFNQVFEKAARDLNQIKAPLKFSAHASQRLQDRKIALDPATLSKVNQAIDQAEAKGIEDTLVLTPNAALIVSVKNRTVITAMDRNSISGNVFTNIDGAVVV